MLEFWIDWPPISHVRIPNCTNSKLYEFQIVWRWVHNTRLKFGIRTPKIEIARTDSHLMNAPF